MHEKVLKKFLVRFEICLKKNRIAGQDTPKIHPDVTCIATKDDEKGCPR